MVLSGSIRERTIAPVGRGRHLLLVLQRELRQLARDRVALTLTFLAPVLAALIASVGLGATQRVDATIAIVTSADARAAVEDVLASYGSDDLDAIVVVSETEARGLLRNGEVAAVVVLPTDSPGVARVLANRIAPLPEALAYDIARLAQLPDSIQVLAPAGPSSDETVQTQPGRRPLDGAELYGPVVAVFFLFLATGVVARSLQVEQSAGTLARMRVMGVRGAPVLAAKAMTMVLVGVIEVGVVLLSMSAVLGARWGDLLATTAVVLAIVLAVASIALLVATLARTMEQAQWLELAIALVLFVLGGNLVPLANLPSAARLVAGLTPNGAAIRAFRHLSAGAGMSDVIAPVLTLLAFAVALGTIAFARARRMVAP